MKGREEVGGRGKKGRDGVTAEAQNSQTDVLLLEAVVWTSDTSTHLYVYRER